VIEEDAMENDAFKYNDRAPAGDYCRRRAKMALRLRYPVKIGDTYL